MKWLASILVLHPVFTWALVPVVVGSAGYARYASLGVDRAPNVDFPTVLVTVRLGGLASDEMQTAIADRLEAAIHTISGIDELRSTSSAGRLVVQVNFQSTKNADVGAQEVRDQINRVLPALSKSVEQPVVSKVHSIWFPI